MMYFLAKDLAALEQKIEETIKQLKAVGEELRLSVTQSSETWHDNFGFENAQQQARMLGQRLDDLEKVRRDATIVNIPTTNKTVSIGHTVTVKDIATGDMHTYAIGSYITYTKGALSYISPIGALLLDKKAGQRTKGIISGKEREFEIVNIHC